MGYFLYEDMAIVKQKRAESPKSSIAQGIALGIRHLRIMRPVRASLTFHCFFTVALTGRVGCLYPFTQGDALGYGGYWAFSPHRMSFDTPSSCICKDNPELLLI